MGRGAYGEVCLVQDVARKRRYALKVMSKGHLQRKGVVRQIRWERELLSMVASLSERREHEEEMSGKGLFSGSHCSLMQFLSF